MDTTETTLTVHSWLSVITFLVVIAIVIRPIRIPLPIPVFKKTTVINDTDADLSALQAPPTLSETTDHTQSQCEDVSNSNYNNNSYVGVDGVPEPSIPHTGTFSSNSLEQLGQGDMADATTHPRNNHLDDSQKRKIHFPYDITLNIATAPVLGVMFLLATKSITGQSVRDGILGEPSSGVEPFAVMVLFFSLAVELATPVAFLMAELQTANIASMALYIGNLTNVVVCQAYKISFVEYSAWMLLPCIASIAACYMMLRITFRKEKYIPKLIKTPLVDPRSCLKDPAGAVFGLAVLGCSLACLIGTSFAHVSVWMVTGPFALIAFARDVWYDVRWYQRRLELGDSVTAVEVAALDDVEMNRVDVTGLPEIAAPGQSIALPIQLHSPVLAEQHLKGTDASSQSKGTSATADEVTIPFPTEVGSIRSVALSSHAPRNTLLGRFQRRFPLLYGIGIRMPWAILPFTFSMFIMVEGLSHSGWIAIFATWATRLVPNYVAATYAIGFVSVLLCNLFNNVPMTILVARILQHPNFANSPLTLNKPEVVRGFVLELTVIY
ncbi:hypothetical protein BGX24_005283 [Mortierella sp. AD032]|nr:hypothetical protein BGX24_005283 [Mortierella sp. AD032]